MSNKILSLIYRSAVNSVLPEQLIRASICIHSQEGILDIVDKITNKHHYVEIADRDVFIFGAGIYLSVKNLLTHCFSLGKGVVGMCQEMLEQIDLFNSARNLPSVRVNFGQLNIPFDCKIEKPEIFQKYNIKYYECARNNIPDEHSVSNTIKMIDSLNKYLATTINPIVIGFITGGGSSLLSLPNSSVSIEDKQKLIKELVQKGANIVELNAIRSNFSQVKSGKLAKQILTWNNNCQLIVLIISDIINDPIEMIASGPTIISRDNPIFIKEIMNKYSIKLDKNLQKIYDKPKSDEYFEINCNKLKNIIIGNNSIALIAAKRQAEKEGFKVILFPFALCGEACLVVEKLVNSAIMYEVTHQDKANYKGVIWLAGGEATIKMDNVENIGLQFNLVK